MLIKCNNCKKEWEYNGNNKYYATCPDCKTSVKLKGVRPGNTPGQLRSKKTKGEAK